MAPDSLRQIELPHRPPAGSRPPAAALATSAGDGAHPVERSLLEHFSGQPRLNVVALALAVALDLGVLAWLVGTGVRELGPPARRTIRLVFMQAPPPPPPPPPPLAGRPARRSPEPVATATPRTHVAATRPGPREVPVEPVDSPRDGEGDEPAGVEGGIAGGTAGGEIGGEIGGELGGVLGGVLGGTGLGDIPAVMMDAKELRVRRMVSPDYPTPARNQGIAGVVEVEAVVAATGAVELVRILRSIPELDDAAMAAVRQWEFEPPRRGARPIRAVVKVMVRFDLRGA